MNKLSTESYKGVRDFYPEDQFIQNYIFGVMRKTVEGFGYSEYNASILEPAELYRAKSGEEIVNEQTYTFTDRGDREVTLRPEMTPTVARMVAGRERELSFPLRWYSIPNVFRYEKPQRGRLREHWQLNVDMIGAIGVTADAEIIAVAHAIMKSFGAKDSDFVIKINSRGTLLTILKEELNIDESIIPSYISLLDKKLKMSEADFKEKELALLGKNIEINTQQNNLVTQIIENLNNQGITNVVYDPSIIRGFTYYTGMVFEVFDTNPENNRSLFGGGRYDDILDMFETRKIPFIGFGMGDVTARDFLETHGLLPAYTSVTDLYICVVKPEFESNAIALAGTLRTEGVNVSVDLSGKKLGEQIKTADKQKIPYIIAIGDNEVESDMYTVKELATGVENRVDVAGIVNILKQ